MVENDVATTQAGRIPEEKPRMPRPCSRLGFRRSLKGVREFVDEPMASMKARYRRVWMMKSDVPEMIGLFA
jgi:hypothetical protein